MTSITRSVALETRQDVAVLLVDNPPVNALSQHVREGLLEGVRLAGKDPAVRAIVLGCKGRTFIAGADITEFGKPPQPPSLFDALDAIERLRQAGGRCHPRHRARRRSRGGPGMSLPSGAAEARASASRRSSSACFRAPAEPSGCRAWSASRWRSRW